MKVVIEVDSSLLKDVREHLGSYDFGYAIAEGVPLDQVLEEIKKEIQFEDSICNGMVMSTDIYKHCIDIIDKHISGKEKE